jgi:hypothetical protein
MNINDYILYFPHLQSKIEQLLSIARKYNLEIEVLETAKDYLEMNKSMGILIAIENSLYEWDCL